MKRFDLNSNVIALTNPADETGQPRVKGKVYKVEAMRYCEHLGFQMVNIGVKSENETFECRCGKFHKSSGMKWTHSEHFVLADKNEIEKELEQAVSVEDYELAVVLRDIKIFNK